MYGGICSNKSANLLNLSSFQISEKKNKTSIKYEKIPTKHFLIENNYFEQDKQF